MDVDHQRTEVDGLPVRLLARGPHADSIRRWVESVAGWQPVDPETARLVPPRVCLLDAHARDRVPLDIPTILLVCEDDDPAEAADAGRTADEVVRWPDDRARLADVAEALSRRHVPEGGRVELTVAGAAGGVGTTTVALALGGLLAWGGAEVLVVAHGTVPVPEAPRRRPDDLVSAGTWDTATPVPGVPGLRVVLTERQGLGAPVDPGSAGWVVRDGGLATDADVLVLRPDRAGLLALAEATAPVVVVVGEGPASDRALAGAASGRRCVRVPWSSRVARAGLLCRVPSSVPGAWLRRLRPVLDGGGA